METVTVNAKALRDVLTSLLGESFRVRELQATMNPDLFPDNPINVLVKEFNEQANRQDVATPHETARPNEQGE